MSVSLQVIYPVSDGSHFDHGYYATTHMALVDQHIAPHTQSIVVTKGLAGGPDVPAPFHAVATMVFANEAAMNTAMQAAGPALEDLPNFTNVQPQILIGEVVR
ncbi:EthD family reductase [Leisingera sp. SS27]|uniref:EthD family reductase n=1 Tax=Leisingera sp. SS27 TaxID=2979462 RepID=UPI00232FB705|nr:EthD family reductase [Leisingera sp. SS27]MDC0658414.1 EthD family reductase [Leisingera sp. SS27]